MRGLQIRATADISGAVTNRVKVKKRSQSAGYMRKSYRSDPAVRGMATVVACISMPIAELERLDEICASVEMARSHFIRQAVKHFAEKIGARWRL